MNTIIFDMSVHAPPLNQCLGVVRMENVPDEKVLETVHALHVLGYFPEVS